MTADPWAAADNATIGQNGGSGGQSQMADSYAGQPSQLFSGGDGAGPSILNKTHPIGTERVGIIAKPPYDRHSTNMEGKLKYWQDGKDAPVLDAVNPATRDNNRKVLDTIVVLDTDYVMDAAEAKATGREQPFEGGQRSLILSGKELKKFKAEIGRVAQDLGIRSDKDLVGLQVRVKRVSEEPNPKGGPTIKHHEFRIEKA